VRELVYVSFEAARMERQTGIGPIFSWQVVRRPHKHLAVLGVDKRATLDAVITSTLCPDNAS
jgi:hypothetical protein